MFKKLMIIFLFTLFLAGAVGAVSAENSTDVSIDLGGVSGEPVSVENSEILSSSLDGEDTLGADIDISGPKVDIDVPDVDIKGPKVDIEGPEGKLKGPKVKGDVDVNVPKVEGDLKMPSTAFYGYDLLGEQQQQVQQQQQQIIPISTSIHVEKVWEGNDSGDITQVEIQLLRYRAPKISMPDVDISLPKSPEISLGDDSENPVYEIVNITDDSGIVHTYEIIKSIILSKENNWTGVFDNLDPNYSYIVREINLPDNAELVSVNLTNKSYTYNENGIPISNEFWKVTNKYNPPANETRKVSEPPQNSTVENTTAEEVPVTDEIVNITATSEDTNVTVETNETEEISHEVEKVSDVKNATGNPLVLLLMVIALIGVPVLRRKD